MSKLAGYMCSWLSVKSVTPIEPVFECYRGIVSTRSQSGYIRRAGKETAANSHLQTGAMQAGNKLREGCELILC